MDEPGSIKRTPPTDKSMDFDFLRKEAIRHAQQLSGDTWTDYNEHDPGVTLLEYLAYAITDLGYRTSFDIKDLLYAREGKKATQPEYLLENGKEPPINGFFGPAAILPAAPITETDYRKLIIDRCNHLVKNAWFQPITDQEQGFRGLYRVLLQLAEDYNPENDSEAVAEVRHLLAGYRNLCEDIEEIRILQTEPVTVFADVYLAPDAFGEFVLAAIIFELEEYLSPSIPFYRQDELLSMGLETSQVFDGPLPLYGFIRTEDLRPLNPAVIVSQLRDMVAGIEGVRSVNNLYIRKKGARIYGDEIAVAPDTYLVLSSKEMISPEAIPYPIRLIKDGEEVPVNFSQVLRIYHNLAAKKRKVSRLPLDLDESPPLSEKDLAGIRNYYSFQRLLPGVYGIGSYGLPDAAGRKRKAQANQLKGYLMVFEQILAQYLSQLAGLRQLFSLSEKEASTYFVRFPFDIPDALTLQLFEPDAADLPPAKAREIIQQKLDRWMQENFDPGLSRRNRFLDHLLGRFGELFTGDHLKAIIRTEALSSEVDQALTRTKIRFLQQYPKLSRDRANGFNYLENAWENDNVSTLKKRICLLMNIPNNRNCSLTAGLTLADKPTGEVPETDKTTRLPLKTMLRLGRDEHRYKIVRSGDDQWRLLLMTSPDPAAAGTSADGKDEIAVFTGPSRQACEEARTGMMEKLAQINAKSEGFFIVEHLLLRPKRNSGVKLVYRVEDTPGSPSIVFKSIDYQPLSSLSQVLNDLIFLGTIFMNETGTGRLDQPEFPNSNYFLLEDPEKGGYYLLLVRKNVPLLIAGIESETGEEKLVSISPFKNLPDARAAINRAMAHLDSFKSAPAGLSEFTEFEREPLSGQAFVERNFYSHRLSIVLPDWPTHFQNPDFRSFFEQTVRLNIPVHLGVRFKWLPFKQMKAFEKTYRSWLEASIDDRGGDQVDDLATDLLRFLLQDGEADARIAAARKATKARLTPLSFFTAAYNHPVIRFSFFLKEDDLQVVDGIGPESEGILKSAGIKTWLNLAVKKEADLERLFTDARFRTASQNLKSWIEQARAAAEGKWSALLEIQRNNRSTDTAENISKTQSLVKAEQRALSQYSSRFEATDLTLFEGIDADLEKRLQALGINTWKDLADAGNLEALKDIDPAGHISWKVQAEMAIRADWVSLRAYQARIKKDNPGMNPPKQ